MFKFIESKKGFTLVELMIVVVIMAILVAVAVPIYSSVTANSRKKTCLSNQREIQSQLNNMEMGGSIILHAGDVYTLTSKSSDNTSTADFGEWSASSGATLTVTNLNSFFQKPPICPVAGNTITVTIESSGLGGDDSGYKVSTVCNKTGSKEVHGS